MRKHLLYLLPVFAILSSCSKSIEDRLIGSWKVDQAYRKVFLGRDYFQTGYEDGVFTFSENGDASYVSPTDTLTGSWRADRYSSGYYNSSGNWESQSMRHLRINLVNFVRNKVLNWEFDDFNFRNTWQRIKADQFSLSNDRVYEFVRK